MPDPPDSLDAFIHSGETRDLSLAVVNRTRPQPIQNMLEDTFGEETVEVEELDVATSPLEELESEILMVNSDLYITGAKALGDVDLPSVIANLTETPFRVRGYPVSDSEKLPLIMISRYIEQLAWQHETGRLRSSFQRLSRLDDERGTRRVYRTLGETDLDVHVYGVPDWLPPETFPGVIHAGYHGEFRSSWFVVHHAENADVQTAALIAERVGDNEWEALWTFEDERVSAINRYIERDL